MQVGVVGIGGLGHLAVQFAAAVGAEVYAISSSADKWKEALDFGAKHSMKFTELPDNTLDIILNTATWCPPRPPPPFPNAQDCRRFSVTYMHAPIAQAALHFQLIAWRC